MCFSAPGSGWPWNTDPDPKYFIKENVMSNSDILKQLNETMKNFRESRVPITCIYTKIVSKENKCISCCYLSELWGRAWWHWLPWPCPSHIVLPGPETHPAGASDRDGRRGGPGAASSAMPRNVCAQPRGRRLRLRSWNLICYKRFLRKEIVIKCPYK